MAKRRTVLAAGLLAFLTLFSGCRKITANPVSAENTDVSSSAESLADDEKKWSAGVAIQTPEFSQTEDSALTEQLKILAKEGAESRLGISEDSLSLAVASQIKTSNSTFLSVLYQGSAETENAPHPTYLMYTTNLDLTTQTPVTLNDIVTIDSAFAQLVRTQMEQTLDELQLSFFNENEEQLLNRLLAVDTADSKDSSAFSDGTLELYFQVPPVAGDFLQIVHIPREQWQSYTKDVPYFD